MLCACAALLCLAGPATAQQRPPCSDLLREFDRVVSHPGTGEVDPIKLGKKLDVDPLWVERCADTYGRRLSRLPRRSGLAKEDQDEVWESEEPEEIAREEFEARNDVYVHELKDEVRKRRHLKRFSGDSSSEWQPFVTHEWRPSTSMEWEPYMLNEKFGLDQ